MFNVFNVFNLFNYSAVIGTLVPEEYLLTDIATINDIIDPYLTIERVRNRVHIYGDLLFNEAPPSTFSNFLVFTLNTLKPAMPVCQRVGTTNTVTGGFSTYTSGTLTTDGRFRLLDGSSIITHAISIDIFYNLVN